MLSPVSQTAASRSGWELKFHTVLPQNRFAFLERTEVDNIFGFERDAERLFQQGHQAHMADGVPDGDGLVATGGKHSGVDVEGVDKGLRVLVQIRHPSFASSYFLRIVWAICGAVNPNCLRRSEE